MPRDSALPARLAKLLASIPGVRLAKCYQDGAVLVVVVYAKPSAFPRLDKAEPAIVAYCDQVGRGPVRFERQPASRHARRHARDRALAQAATPAPPA